MPYVLGVAVDNVENKETGRFRACVKAIDSLPRLKWMCCNHLGIDYDKDMSMLDRSDEYLHSEIATFIEKLNMRVITERGMLIETNARYTIRVSYRIECDEGES